MKGETNIIKHSQKNAGGMKMLKKLFAAMLSLNFVFGLCVPISAQNTEQESEITESKTTEKSDYAEIIFNK